MNPMLFRPHFCIKLTINRTIAPATSPIPKLINVGVKAPMMLPLLVLFPHDPLCLQLSDEAMESYD